MKKYFISLLLILAPVMATAQNDTIERYDDKEYYKYLYYKLLCHKYLEEKDPAAIDTLAEYEIHEPAEKYTKKFTELQDEHGLYHLWFVSDDELENFKAGKSKREMNNEITKLRTDTMLLGKKLRECQAQLNRIKTHVPGSDQQIKKLKKNNDSLISQIDTAYICLEAISYNFLYIPYEAFSIKNIAIPAFNAINDPYIKEAGKVKFSLLQSYETDIKELLVCYRKIEDELDLSYDGIEYVEKIKGTDVYNNYNKYDDWENTYLGKNILLAISRMESFTRKNKTSLKDLIAELEKCLKTEEDL